MTARPGASTACRLARITAGATLLLVMAGGLVTSTGSGLAVPDWPTTFGYNLFLFPWSRMVGGVLVEHSHRLLGAAVGLLTLGLGVAIWVTDARAWVRTLGALAVTLVGVQGLLGGLRVLLLQDVLALVHGCLAQAFFGLVVALAVFTGPAWTESAGRLAPEEGPALRRLSGAVTGLLYGQIVLGALATHRGWALSHLAGAFVVVAGVGVLAGRVLALRRPGAGLLRWALGLAGLLALQVALGLGAYVARFTGWPVPGGPDAGVAFPVAHRAVAAGLLGATVALTLRIWRGTPAAGARPAGALDARLASTRVPA